MRFATWNCCSGGIQKIERLGREGVDVAVISEAPLLNPWPFSTLIEGPLSWCSTGDVPFKALAVVSFSRTLTRSEPTAGEGRWTLAVDVEDGPSVLSIWSCPRGGGAPAYADQVIRSLEAHAEQLMSGGMIVAGDFNVGQALAPGVFNDWVAPVKNCWESLGLVSVYHHFYGEPMGRATRPTYFHRRHPDRGFHIDYVLMHRRRLDTIKHVSIGGFDQWVASGFSDHIPLFVDLDS